MDTTHTSFRTPRATRRVPRLLAALMLAAALAPLLVPSTGGAAPPPALQAVRAGRPLDLPAMVIGPADLPSDGYGTSNSDAPSLTAYAASLNRIAGGRRAEAAALEEELEETGWRQAYRIILSLPSDEDPDLFGRSIFIQLVQYADVAGAEAGYDLLADIYEAGGFAAARGGSGIGDQAALFRGSGTTDSGRLVEELSIIIRAKAIVAQASVVDFADDAPPTSEAEKIGTALVDRIGAIRENGSAGLGLVVQRLEGDGVTTERDYYRRIDGELRTRYRESESDFEADDAWHEEHRQTDVYVLRQIIAAEDERDPALHYLLEISRFEDEAAAAAFVDDYPAAFAESPSAGYSDVELIEDAPEFGDQSALLSFVFTRRDGTEAGGYEYVVRVGATVANVQLNGVPAAPLAVLEDLAEGQAACLEGVVCDRVPAAPGTTVTGSRIAFHSDRTRGPGVDNPTAAARTSR
jgi:hypothetical protein